VLIGESGLVAVVRQEDDDGSRHRQNQARESLISEPGAITEPMRARLLAPDRRNTMHQPLEVLDAGAERLREQLLPAGFADEVTSRAAGLAGKNLKHALQGRVRVRKRVAVVRWSIPLRDDFPGDWACFLLPLVVSTAGEALGDCQPPGGAVFTCPPVP